MVKRPSLSELVRPKPGAVAADVEPGPETGAEASGKRAATQPDGRKGILVRVAPEGWRQLRDLAADLTLTTGEQVTMQSLILDAINELLRENGRSPVA